MIDTGTMFRSFTSGCKSNWLNAFVSTTTEPLASLKPTIFKGVPCSCWQLAVIRLNQMLNTVRRTAFILVMKTYLNCSLEIGSMRTDKIGSETVLYRIHLIIYILSLSHGSCYQFFSLRERKFEQQQNPNARFCRSAS